MKIELNVGGLNRSDKVESIDFRLTKRLGQLTEADGAEETPGDVLVVQNLAKYLNAYGSELLKHSQTGNVREARLRIIEIASVVEQAKAELSKLAKEAGLPDLELGGK